MENFNIKDIFIAHANPFGTRNWEYLNSEKILKRALKSLLQEKYQGGIFGHVHRALICSNKANKLIKFGFPKTFNSNSTESSDTFLATSPSVGQPRGSKPGFLYIHFFDEEFKLESINLDYSKKECIEVISKSHLSISTKSKLSKFFR